MIRAIVFALAVLAVLMLCHVVADDSQATMSSVADSSPSAESVQQGLTSERMGSMQLAFTQNNGQWDKRVKFRANAGGATVWFTTDAVYYQFTRHISKNDEVQNDPVENPHERFDHEAESIEQLVIKASFAGANPSPEIIGEEMMEYKCNYFLGNDPTKWRTDVPNYGKVTLRGIYEGVDIEFFGGTGGKLMYKYSFTSRANSDHIILEYQGSEEIEVDRIGTVTSQTKWGEIKGLLAPPSENADIGFSELSMTSATISPYDIAEDVPEQRNSRGVELVYSTYLGGTGSEAGNDIAVDGSGHAYVMGTTKSGDFPTQNPYQTYQGDYDVFVTKLSSSGNTLIYSTYLGGGDRDFGRGIAVDGSGNAYVTGPTLSSDFPTQNPYQTDQEHTDVFVTKLSSSGDSLIYSTYLGGGDYDSGYSIAVDGSGHAYVTGRTNSPDFPTQDAYQTCQGDVDAFVTKLASSGNSLIYSTCLGGGAEDRACAIAVDGNDNAYVTGGTYSSDFPSQNPYQTYQGGMDAFVTKLSSSGDGLIYSTFLGGGYDDSGEGIVVDGSGNAYVAGKTASFDFPIQNPYQINPGGWNVFVTKLSSSGDGLSYSTYVGGGIQDLGQAIAIDGSGNAYVTGLTLSSDFPTQNPFQTHQGPAGYYDAFALKLSASGSYLIYSTYLRGGEGDNGLGIAVDSGGNAYVAGWTHSTDFPTQNPFQTLQGPGDAFVTKLGAFTVRCGDANVDGAVDIDDVVYLIAYIFSGGPEPVPYEFGDADCSGGVDIDDVVWLIGYIFSGGNAPCDTDGDDMPDC